MIPNENTCLGVNLLTYHFRHLDSKYKMGWCRCCSEKLHHAKGGRSQCVCVSFDEFASLLLKPLSTATSVMPPSQPTLGFDTAMPKILRIPRASWNSRLEWVFERTEILWISPLFPLVAMALRNYILAEMAIITKAGVDHSLWESNALPTNKNFWSSLREVDLVLWKG